MEEVWKDVIGYEGFYLVSNTGNIYGVVAGRAISIKTEKNGYKRVTLNRSGVRKTISVHRLVVEAFIEPITEGFCVDHIDNNRGNNHISNLRIVTYTFNVKRSFCNTLGISKMRKQKTTPQRFRADMWIYGRKYFLGSWDTEQEALKAYRETHFYFWGYHYARQE